jgi:hypothetical protein
MVEVLAAVCGKVAVVRLTAEDAADSATGRRTGKLSGTGAAAVGPLLLGGRACETCRGQAAGLHRERLDQTFEITKLAATKARLASRRRGTSTRVDVDGWNGGQFEPRALK